MKPLVILTGPTAVGKSDLSISLAKALNGAIISADSMQVYKGLDIGSAKIMPEEMSGVDHYLIDVLDPKDDFNVARFQAMAKEALDEIYDKGQIPIVVGGTGFYIQALLYDIDFTKEDNSEIRNKLEADLEVKGPEYMHNRLKEIDPESAYNIHPNNTKRVIRAIEYYMLNGKKISDHNQAESQKKSNYDFRYFVLDMDRDKLYERIDLRVDLMEKAGLVEEVKSLKEMGLTREYNSMAGIGYKEILDYLDGLCSLEDALYTIKRDSRHFAKRQLTWFRRERDVIWVNKDKFDSDEEILDFMIKECNFND